MIKNVIKLISRLNFKTIYFNLKYLPLRQALLLPILVSKRTYLRNTSGKIKINAPLRTGLIRIGYGNIGIFDEKRSRTIWEVNGTVIFNGTCNIGHGSKISVSSTGSLSFGENFAITAETSIITKLNIGFGDNCLLSWDTLIMDSDLHKIKNEVGSEINAPQPISIGDNVWIGCRCLILKGAKIPNNTIIGASSLVNKPLDKENSLYAGSPCKLIKENVSWER
ncbi:acyltransferase [Dyadobacter sp. BHUBP1]|uniref:acyltransferase n=1 Tax=Dyadobacter sp. BHUBP1 TaxID=3424178 RepID=UPI003D349CAA